jgi:deazaflavin-dependent oxidoreductase (nitroreductase family)
MSSSSLPAELPEWIRNHVSRYLESDGADGHLWDSSVAGGSGMVPTLLLTTTGRKSGRSLLLPLIYAKTATGYAIVASKGGAPAHPAWYLNLSANAEVDVQVAAEKFKARARTLGGGERAKVWEQMVAIYPPYTAYQARTEREIPVVVLEPVTG